MKKKLCNVLMAFFLMFMMTGCVKFNASMDIKKNKSMDFKIIYAFDTTYFGDEELLDDSDKKELQDDGFTVSDYVDGDMKGFTISKNIKNIDDVSSTEDIEYSLSGLLEANASNKYIFKVKKGLFKNTYTAKLNFDSSDSSLNDSSDSEDDYDYDYDYSEDDYDYDFSDMTASMDLNFNVTLPYAAISNNATTVSNDGKTLKWELTTTDASSMEFEFELYNMTAIYIGVAIIIVLVVAVIIFICRKKGNKSVNTGYKNSRVYSSQPTQDNMEQNISRDVYQSSLQSVQNTVQPQINEQPIQMNQPVQSIPVSPVNPTTIETPVQEQPTMSIFEAPKATESTIQNSVRESVQSIQPMVSQTEVSNEVISNPVNQNETLDINSDNQNLN